jgi:glycosyl transferase family 25
VLEQEVPMRVFVINLERAAHRRVRMQDQFERAGFSAAGIEYLRAVDAQDLTADRLDRLGARLFDRWKQPDSPAPYHSRALKWGEIACSLSHIEVWRRIAASEDTFALVLEDDVVFVPDAHSIIQQRLSELTGLKPGWDLCYVGRQRMGPPFGCLTQPEAEVGPNLVVPTFSYCAHAYALSRAGAARLLAAGLERAVIPVDEFLPALYAPHPRQDVRAVFGEGDRIRAFATAVSLAHQPKLDRSSIETSADVLPTWAGASS